MSNSVFFDHLMALKDNLPIIFGGKEYVSQIIGSAGDMITLKVNDGAKSFRITVHYTSIVVSS